MSDTDLEMFNRNLMKALVADNDKQRAEIERLRSENEDAKEAYLRKVAEIERLRAAYHNAESNVLVLSGEIERLEATLRPFADFDTEDFKDEMRMFSDVPSPTIGDFRRARAALAGTEGK